MADRTMANSGCCVEGCGGARYKRDWCAKHYRAWWTYGDPMFSLRVSNGGRCSVLGCDRPPRSSTSPHCEVHYYRLRRNGTLDTVLAPHRIERADGYVLTPAAGHPMALGRGHAYEHRVVFFDAHGAGPHACHVCGREDMLENQHVDHLNEVRNDNRLENLKAACPDCNEWRGKDRAALARTSPNVHWLEHNGLRLPMSEWAKRIGITPQSLSFRLRQGWSLDRALTAPRGVTGPRRAA